ncbi:hypothetical protein GEMRC1_008067 [Eukaryota sp. GEM-RC1]
MGILDFLRGKPPVDPAEEAKEWRKKLRSEKRGIERQIRRIETEERRVQANIKQIAREGRGEQARILAKELVRSRKSRDRLWSARAQLNSVEMSITTNLGTAKMAQAMGQSSSILQSMSDLVKLPELSQTMMAMAREMEKAGVIDEMVNDTIDDALGDEDEESEVEEHLDSVLSEILQGDMLSLKGPSSKVAQGKAAEENNAEDEELQQRMQALRG